MNEFVAGLAYVMAGITLYVGSYNLLFYRSIQDKKEHFFFGLLCYAVAAYQVFSARLYESQDFATSLIAQRGQFSSAGVITVLFALFIYRFVGKPLPKILRGALFFWLGFSILIWFGLPGTLHLENQALKVVHWGSHRMVYRELEPGALITVFYTSILIGMGWGYYHLLRNAGPKNHRITRAFGITLALFFLAAINDVLVGTGVIQSFYLLEFSYLGILFIVDQVLMEKFTELYRVEGRLNAVLEDRVAERTHDVEMLLEDVQNKNAKLERINERLLRLSERDSLTGVYNHGCFQDRLEAGLNMAARHGIPIGVGMIDIDHFKKFNDECGHQAGDDVLLAVAATIAGEVRSPERATRTLETMGSELRNYDVIGRYGGDEFAIMVPFCDWQKAEINLARMLESVRQLKLPSLEGRTITVSVGFCLLEDPKHDMKSDQVLARADECMYQAKKLGRNRFVIGQWES